MRFACPQITWHGGENGKNAPVLSLDFHPTDRQLFVTAGSDAEARVKLFITSSKNKTSHLTKLLFIRAALDFGRRGGATTFPLYIEWS